MKTKETNPSTPAKKAAPKATPKKSAPKAAKSSGGQSLAQAQATAQKSMTSGSASFDQVHAFLAKKANRGLYFSPGQIAIGIGEGCTDKAVRKSLQNAGLAKGKQGVIEAGADWLALHKAGNRNTYTAFNAGAPLPVAK